MPFTFSHPAIVLPLNHLSKKWVSLTALVVGAMTPDFEYFIRMRSESRYSHTWLGLLWFDLPLGLLIMLTYNTLIKNKLIDHLPGYFNTRLSPLKNKQKLGFYRRWFVIAISILIGGASHIIWDGFTHYSGYFVQRIPLLTEWISLGNHGIHVFNLLQHLSSAVGAAAILFAIAQLPEGEFTGKRNINIFYYWGTIFLIMLLVVAVRLLTTHRFFRIADLIDTAISGALIGLVIVSAVTPSAKIETD
jgi:hypothetical protein